MLFIDFDSAKVKKKAIASQIAKLPLQIKIKIGLIIPVLTAKNLLLKVAHHHEADKPQRKKANKIYDIHSGANILQYS